MLIMIYGASASGKTELAKHLQKEGCKQVITYTTRKIRPGEVDGQDYHFLSVDDFKDNIDDFVEWDEYTQNRFYGTSYESIYEAAKSSDLYCIVLTPNGIRSCMEVLEKHQYCTVCVTARLGTRVRRYIERCGDSFNFDDLNEIYARVNRDYGMFLGTLQMANLWIENNTDDESELVSAAKKIKSHVS